MEFLTENKFKQTALANRTHSVERAFREDAQIRLEVVEIGAADAAYRAGQAEFNHVGVDTYCLK